MYSVRGFFQNLSTVWALMAVRESTLPLDGRVRVQHGDGVSDAGFFVS